MKTDSLYLVDPYKQTVDATIVDVVPDASGIFRIILDQTIFYPMGGGQPTDQGTLVLADGTTFFVYQVLLKEGEIAHYVKSESPPTQGQNVHATIDWQRRYKNMRVHAAGHVVDFALYRMGYIPSQLTPIKGDHGKKPHIVYQGMLDPDICKELEKEAQALVQSAKMFSWNFESLDVLQRSAIYLQPNLPIHKPLRVLHLEGVGSVADGGTIVQNTQEIGTISVPSVVCADMQPKVTYQVQ